jgi:hypothetical protein
MRRAILTLLLIAVTTASPAAVELEERGYTVIRERLEEGIALYDVRDSAGNALTLGTATGGFSNQDMNILEILREIFLNMEHLTFSQMKVVFSRNQAEVVVTPRRYSYDGIDLAALMPSGMRFVYTDFLEYDFRMLVEGLFIRMEGHYFTEQRFLERLVRAARNPTAYIQSTDPRYIFSRLDELSDQITLIEESGVEMSSEIEGLVESFREFRSDANRGVRRLEQALRQEMEEIGAAYQSLLEEQSDLRRQLELMRRAVLVFENRGWLGTLRIPEERVVREIVALKAANPEMSIEEAQTIINEGGEESLSKKVVTLVYSLYFNEFE